MWRGIGWGKEGEEGVMRGKGRGNEGGIEAGMEMHWICGRNIRGKEGGAERELRGSEKGK